MNYPQSAVVQNEKYQLLSR
ncbi:uncharacterized protein CELE_Y17D7B.10 [Caenorhabditis elegans]|uniref:Uncharacterized protein n=1 Tax=Caenorhabditis elegans TaxID=6239 RepID=D3NQ93_CAEEL|nr:Uncharacterized protein CELE_Y17D7B.10 [Caenorhabditis elegans]CBK19488.1 Uncharacterized protein CELE_Y17D7B.10 [Caenorhabditis elegans]|eukprot:NP_001256824.1 Uncharacterized protein CELE_Y17D7B.10 [Caenorhabditis elegans]